MTHRDVRSRGSLPPGGPYHEPAGTGTSRRLPMRQLRGIAVSPGIAIGPTLTLDPAGLVMPPRGIEPAAVAAELERLDSALKAAEAEADAAEADARQRLGPQYADILSAHSRMVSDPSLRQSARERIENDRIRPEHAVRDVLEGLAERLEDLADPHLAARAADVRDIQRRILQQFAASRPPNPLESLETPSLVLAHDLSPSQTATLDPSRVLGFATEAGGQTSHTAIVAAALEIPAVVGLGAILPRARASRTAIIDGDEGLVVLDPDAPTLKRYRQAAADRAARFAELADQASLPAQTRDGTRLRLMGNIEFPAEIHACQQLGAEGIGLYRTEFLYLSADRPPTEDEQYAAYATVVRAMSGQPVTIRTLDLGADKLASYEMGHQPSRNPFLGLRSIRLSLRDHALFRTQLRAILRASVLGDVRVMFPLIATLSEFRRARAVLGEVAAELNAEGVPVRADLPVGAMIEVPAAAMMADHLAREVDFFSIGTNDLVQYTLAVDRSDEAVAELYNTADPAVLRLIAGVVEAAKARTIEVNVCGTMGGDPLYLMLLLGMGLRQLSMPPHQIPEIKRVVRAIGLDQARGLAAEVLRLDTAEAVTARLREELLRAIPDTPRVGPSDDSVPSAGPPRTTTPDESTPTT
jgi:phosphotransferase system enzyme I (PtsI)